MGAKKDPRSAAELALELADLVDRLRTCDARALPEAAKIADLVLSEYVRISRELLELKTKVRAYGQEADALHTAFGDLAGDVIPEVMGGRRITDRLGTAGQAPAELLDCGHSSRERCSSRSVGGGNICPKCEEAEVDHLAAGLPRPLLAWSLPEAAR